MLIKRWNGTDFDYISTDIPEVEPVSPAHGQLWLDPSALLLKRWNDTPGAWEVVGLSPAILTAKGAMFAASASGVVSETRAQAEGQVPVYHGNDANGIVWESPSVGRRTFSLLANPGLATAQTDGFPAAYTLSTTASNADDAQGPWVNHATATANPSHSGVLPAAYVYARPGWLPDVEFHVKSDPSLITLSRYFVGLSSALPDGSTIPTTLHGAYFKYETNGAVTQWQCCTAAGAAPTVANSGVVVAANTRYKLRIEFVGTLGSNPTSIRFLINDLVVATATSTLPLANQTMSPLIRVSTLTTVARNLKWAKIIMAAG